MNPQKIFAICNLVAMLGWTLLIFTPRKHWVSTVLAGRVIPLLLATVYLCLLAAHWGESAGGFGSLKEVASLFANPWMLLAGWVHYLAFDLFVGAWEVQDAAKNAVSHLLVIPCLLLTFLFGPIGLLSYFAVRAVVLRGGVGR